MARALGLIDVLKDFEHEDGDRLLASFRQRHDGLVRTLARARAEGTPVVYANDDSGATSDAPALVRRAVEGKGGRLVEAIAPQPGEAIVLKRTYSAFYETPLASLLRERGIHELELAGAATEMCVFQTALDGIRLGFEVSVLADACATIDERNEALALSYLEDVLGVAVSRRPERIAS